MMHPNFPSFFLLLNFVKSEEIGKLQVRRKRCKYYVNNECGWPLFRI